MSRVKVIAWNNRMEIKPVVPTFGQILGRYVTTLFLRRKSSEEIWRQ